MAVIDAIHPISSAISALGPMTGRLPNFSSDELEKFTRIALEKALSAKLNGNHPFGAILVDSCSKEVLCTAENTVVTLRCPTKHAELNLVEVASQLLTVDQIHKCVLFTSTEPCPMCCGAIYWSGIRCVVYSFPALELGKLANDTFCGPCHEVFDKAIQTSDGKPPRAGTESLRTVVIGPILIDEGRTVHGSFWQDFI